MQKIKRLSIPKTARIIVISDIHGELELFKKLLGKVHFSQDDYLIINGDLSEKGSNSAGVISYVMDLSASNPKVHVTEGNCDTIVEDLLDENPLLMNYLCAKKHTLLNEWLETLGYVINQETTVQEVKENVIQHFSAEINWLNDLPTAIETEDYIFVHAGLEDIEDWKNTKRETALAIPAFLNKSHQAKQYVIVGHWPVVNYSSDIPSDNPVIDHEKRIIAIDGGNLIKQAGQLNALIIEQGDFSYTYVDRFPTCKVEEHFQADPKMVGSISYPFYEITPIEEGEYFTLCMQKETDQLLYVKNEYIDENVSVKTDVSCAQISVNKGDIVSVLNDSCAGYTLIKKDGVIGWVINSILG